MLQSEALDAAISIIGSQVALARKLRISKAAVGQWKDEGRRVPLSHCAAIESATGGIVTCEDLRPDISWSRIPDPSWLHPKGRPVIDPTRAPVDPSDSPIASPAPESR
jgi:Uncharacterized protein conserved in bacteria, prophage-related